LEALSLSISTKSSYRAVVQRKPVYFKFSISNFKKSKKRHRYARALVQNQILKDAIDNILAEGSVWVPK